MSTSFQTISHVAGPAADVLTLHRLILTAELAGPAEVFSYRWHALANKMAVASYYSADSRQPPSLHAVLAPEHEAIGMLKVCVFRGHALEDCGTALCFYRGETLSDHELSPAVVEVEALNAFKARCCADFAVDASLLNAIIARLSTL